MQVKTARYYPMVNQKETDVNAKRISFTRKILEWLNKPRTPKWIVKSIRESGSRMTQQDVRKLLRRFEKESLITCLNPESHTGRFFVRVDALKRIETSIDWTLLGKILTGSARLEMLSEFNRLKMERIAGSTATTLRKRLRERYLLTLNNTLRTIAFLESAGLIRCIARTEKRGLRLIEISEKGQRILGAINDTLEVPTGERMPVT